MHLFAISGLHIGVIATGIYALLSLLRLPRPVLFVTSLTVLWLYVDITGATPSAVRAFTMVAAFQSAMLFRLPGNPLAALALSAAVVLLFAPMQLFSASFQMSYSVVAAILLLGLPLADWLQQRWQPFAWLPESAWDRRHRLLAATWRGVSVAGAIGLASIMISALTGIMYFQLFTPGALLANLILIPAAMFVILGGTTSLLCGLAGFTAGSFLCNHATGVVLQAIERSVRLLVELPAMYWPAVFRAEWIGPVGLGTMVAAMLIAYARGEWSGPLRRSLPVLVLTLTLIFGVKFG
jgi:competence protein ComEC